MENLIQYDDYVIGYKEDIIKYHEKEIMRLRKDETIDNEELSFYMQQVNGVLEELKKYDDYTLLAIGENWNSDFIVKQATIEFEF